MSISNDKKKSAKPRLPLPVKTGGPQTSPKGKKGYSREQGKEEKKRIIELEECLEVVLARMNQFLIIDVRPMLSGNENDSL